MKNIKLNRQLRRAGATRQEARDLAALTTGLRQSVPHLDAAVKRQIAQDIGLHQWPVYARPRWALAGAFVGLLILSVLAQFAQPGSPLYAIKRATDEVRIILQPSIKADLEHQRADEQRRADDQQKTEQKIESAPSNRVDGQSDSVSPSDGTSGAGTSPGSGGGGDSPVSGGSDGRGVELKIDSSGSGSGSSTTPVLNDSSGKSIDGGGSDGGSSNSGSNHTPRL